MVMMVEPIMKSVKSLKKSNKRTRTIVLTAAGKTLTQAKVKRLTKYDQLIMISGRYEGIDERVATYVADEQISIGDYVLFGGEVPAMVIIEAVTRLLPGAIGKQKSLQDESFKALKGIENHEIKGILEYPHFTRPEVIKIDGKKRLVPKILLTGDHAKIEIWRREQAISITKKRRPDLL